MTPPQIARAAVVVALAAACSSKSSSPPPAPPASTPQASGELRWTDAKGQLVGVLHDGKVEGPCGPIATYDASAVKLAQSTVSYTEIPWQGGSYTLPGMAFGFQVAPDGTITERTSDGKSEPAGRVTGLTDDAARARFRALLVATLLYQVPALAIESIDQPPVRMYAWDRGRIMDARGDPLLVPDQPPLRPDALASKDVEVRSGSTGYTVTIDTPDRQSGPWGPEDPTSFEIAEKPPGTLAFGATPFARLPGRLACPAHDAQVLALVRTLFWRRDGLQYLIEHGLPRPPPPPPPPPPRRTKG